MRGVDIKQPEFIGTDADEFELLDLRRWDDCLRATRDVDHVYALAADMGGMGFISSNHATILRNNALINLHTLDTARVNSVGRYLFTSSGCIFPEHHSYSNWRWHLDEVFVRINGETHCTHPVRAALSYLA